MTSVTYLPDLHQTLRQTGDPNDYDLALGQSYEAYVAQILTLNGLPAYQPQQRFILASDLSYHRDQKSCRLTLNPRTGRLESRHFDPSLLRPYQRDLMIKVGKVRRLSVEVKALTPAAYRGSQIWVGCCPKWDLKRFRVDALILVNQETKEIWVAPESSEWLRVKDCNGEMAYAVPRGKLSPPDAWIDAVKDIHTEGLKELS